MRKNTVFKGTRILALILTVILVTSTLSVENIYAATVSISGMNDVSTFEVYKDTSVAFNPVYIDNDVTVSSSNGFVEGYLLFKNTGSGDSSDMLKILSDANTTALNAISVSNNIVYMGTGSSIKQIGSIDATYNGLNGNALKINFATPLANGGFEEDSDNWIFYDKFLKLSGDSSITDDRWFGDNETDLYVKERNPYFNWNFVEPVDGSDAYLYMSIDTQIKDPYGTYHGPYVVSKEFEAQQGDNITLNYYAKNTGDKFDVKGILIDNATGKEQELFSKRGDETDGWEEVSKPIQLASSSRFTFKFICGSQDGTGGRMLGSELLVDNVRITSNAVTSTVVTNIARKVAFYSTSRDPRTNTGDRLYTIEAKDQKGYVTTSSTKATVHIATYPLAPSLSVSAPADTLGVLNASWSNREGASNYDLFLGTTRILDDSTDKTYEFTDLGINTSYSIGVLGNNSYGGSAKTVINRYTNAAIPSLSVNDSDSYNTTLTIHNEGNPSGTAYTIERSTVSGEGFQVIEAFSVESNGASSQTYKDSGLDPNTTYYYRIKARNGDYIATAYSQEVEKTTAPAPPNPVSLQVTTDTNDALDITWSMPGGAITYDVYRDGVLISSSVEGDHITHTGLASNRNYSYHVVAKNAEDQSVASGDTSAFTGADIPLLSLGEATNSQILITIDNQTNPEHTRYRLERSIDGQQWAVFEDFTLLSEAEPTQTYLDTGLMSGTVYYYRIKAINEEEVESQYSSLANEITIPDAATGLTVLSKEGISNSLKLTWTAPVGAYSYDIYRQGVGEEAYSLIAVDYTQTLFQDSGLSPNRLYRYYVVAKNVSGSAPASNIDGAYTYPNIPTISTENSVDTNNLTIGANGNPEEYATENPSGTQYMVEFSTDDGETWEALRDWINFLTPQHQAIDAGLTYTYRVKARNSEGNETLYSGAASARSNEAPVITVTTPSENIYRSQIPGFSSIEIGGTVTDADSDTVNISITMDGVTKSQYVEATPEGVTWSFSFDVLTDSLAESAYASIPVSGNDGYGGLEETNLAAIIYVDQTAPTMPTILGDTSKTNADEVVLSINAGTDMVAGTSGSEYRLSGASQTGWMTYEDAISIRAEGITLIEARSTDAVGNVGEVTSVSVEIDRTSPLGEGFVMFSVEGIEGKTNSRIVDLKNIVTEEEAIFMQISNTADFDGATWVATAGHFDNWSLSEGIGVKTVFMRFKDDVGNIGPAVMSTVIYDDVPPVIGISNPDRFHAKKGMTVSYTLTVNKESTLIGINENDLSKIDLTYMGSFEQAEIDLIKSLMTIDTIDNQTRQLNILLPSSLNGDGTIGVKVLSGAARDTFNNNALEAIANASFVIDAIAPSNQDALFTSDTTLQGGQAVTLDMSSEACEGGYDSDSVRFAPAEYDGVDPADGTSITSTHGRSVVINAPTQAGEYFLYILDAAGNISNPSVAKLTVKNIGPTLTVSSPSDSYVNSGANVDYIVTYSSDTNAISLTQEHVALVTSETANAYVAISDVEGQPLQKKISLRNLMGEGTVQIMIGAGSAVDAYGNPSVASDVSDPVKVDNTPASLTSLSMVSDNVDNSAVATSGNTLVLEFSVNEPVAEVEVTIAGAPRIVTSNPDNTSFTTSYTIPNDEVVEEGSIVPFSITTVDMAGNRSNVSVESDTNINVITDFTPPIIQLEGLKDSRGYYRDGVTITFNEGVATLTNTETNVSDTIESGAMISSEGPYELSVRDEVGLRSVESFTISYDAILIEQDIDSVAIGYQAGDNANSVTRDIELPVLGSAGGVVVWTSNSTAISSAGLVDRKAEDQVVTLTATINRSGLIASKAFNLKVIAAIDEASGLMEVTDDAITARIQYSDEDWAESVTQTLGLSDNGVMHERSITWSSDLPEVITIDQLPVDGWYPAYVTRPLQDEDPVTVILTATAWDPEDTLKYATQAFEVIVQPLEKSDEEKVLEDFEYVEIQYAEGDDQDNVNQDVTFVANVVNESRVTWSTFESPYISDTGEVHIPRLDEGNKEVRVVATIENGVVSVDKTFILTVIKGYTPESYIEEDLENLEIGYYGDDWSESVTTHVVLPTIGLNGSEISWVSENQQVVSTAGDVQRSTVDQNVRVSATLHFDGLERSKDFDLTIINYAHDDILERLYNDAEATRVEFNRIDNAQSVTTDLKLRTAGASGSEITWSSSNSSVIDGAGNVVRPAEDTLVTMTADVKQYSTEIEMWIHRIRQFDVTVLASDAMDLSKDFDDINIIYAYGDTRTSVTASMYLPRVGDTGTTVVWRSNNTTYVSDYGRVTRPSVDSEDKWVTMTATLTHPLSGEKMIKTIDVLIKKLSDQEAVEEAAKNLTYDEAFDFSDGNDTWEAVTDDFWRVTSTIYNTKVTWKSSNPAVVELLDETDENGQRSAKVNRPIGSDAHVILTATFTRGSYTTTKTYLLIVKAEGALKAVIREEVFDVVMQAGQETQDDNLKVYRTQVSNNDVNSTIDTVIVDPTETMNLTETINPNDTDEARTMAVHFDLAEGVDEQAIEVPSVSIGFMAERNMIFEVESPVADIILTEASLRKVESTGSDLYFRMVPIEDLTQKDALTAQVISEQGEAISLLGTPVMIETNYENIDTEIVLPFGDAKITDYNGLQVYVNHSDGTTEVVNGVVVYKDDVPYGLKFTVDHFSDFQLIERPVVATTTTTIKTKTPEEEVEVDTGDDDVDVTVSILTKEEEDDRKGDNKDAYEWVGDLIEVKVAEPWDGHFSQMTSIRIPLEDGQKITTGVRINEDGTIIHIPTEVWLGADYKYYAIIHPLEDGVFGLVYNPMTFEDVIGHFSEDEVNNLYSRLVVTGRDDGYYDPDAPITRAEATAMLVRGLGLLSGQGSQSFTDVAADVWYEAYVQTSENFGLIKGYDDQTFKPNQWITREQMMTIIYRSMVYTGLDTNIDIEETSLLLEAYEDRDRISAYAMDGVAANLKYAIVSGRSETELAPEAAITRGEVAMLIARLLRNSGMID